jgi:hypothetical protein
MRCSSADEEVAKNEQPSDREGCKGARRASSALCSDCRCRNASASDQGAPQKHGCVVNSANPTGNVRSRVITADIINESDDDPGNKEYSDKEQDFHHSFLRFSSIWAALELTKYIEKLKFYFSNTNMVI